MEMYLVRHGETEWSRARRHTGRTDVPLNEVGEAEAKALGQHLRSLEVDRVLSSPMIRAVTTARLAGFGESAGFPQPAVLLQCGMPCCIGDSSSDSSGRKPTGCRRIISRKSLSPV